MRSQVTCGKANQLFCVSQQLGFLRAGFCLVTTHGLGYSLYLGTLRVGLLCERLTMSARAHDGKNVRVKQRLGLELGLGMWKSLNHQFSYTYYKRMIGESLKVA